MPTRCVLRRAGIDDVAVIQAILNEVIAEGTSFLADEALSLDETIQAWLAPLVGSYLACDAASGAGIGAYKITPNLWGRGDHVANGSYVVTRRCRGQGIGYLLG
jgi:hypothetical protein